MNVLASPPNCTLGLPVVSPITFIPRTLCAPEVDWHNLLQSAVAMGSWSSNGFIRRSDHVALRVLIAGEIYRKPGIMGRLDQPTNYSPNARTCTP